MPSSNSPAGPTQVRGAAGTALGQPRSRGGFKIRRLSLARLGEQLVDNF